MEIQGVRSETAEEVCLPNHLVDILTQSCKNIVEFKFNLKEANDAFYQIETKFKDVLSLKTESTVKLEVFKYDLKALKVQLTNRQQISESLGGSVKELNKSGIEYLKKMSDESHRRSLLISAYDEEMQLLRNHFLEAKNVSILAPITNFDDVEVELNVIRSKLKLCKEESKRMRDEIETLQAGLKLEKVENRSWQADLKMALNIFKEANNMDSSATDVI